MIDLKKQKNYLFREKISEPKGKKKTGNKKKRPEVDIGETIILDENIRPLHCYRCKSDVIIREEDIRHVHDIYKGKPTEVVLNKVMYRCTSCNNSFSLDDIYPAGLQYTKEFEDYIAQTMINEECSVKEMSAIYNVSAGYVSTALKNYIYRFNHSDFKIMPCATIYFHKFFYGPRKKVCCMVCGKNSSEGKLKLLAVYEDYSEEIVELFSKKIYSFDDIDIVYYDYDPLINIGKKLSDIFYASTVLVDSDNFLETIKEIGRSIDFSDQEEWQIYRAKLESIIEHPTHNLEPNISIWLSSTLPERFRPYFTSFLALIESCADSFNLVYRYKIYEIDVSPINKVLRSFEKKRYASHIMVIRLMILSRAVRKAILSTDLGRYLNGTPPVMFYRATVAYEISPEDTICRYIDVDDLLKEYND